MGNDYRIEYLEQFFFDLDSAAKYIKYQLNNPQAANRLIEDILGAIKKRSSNAKSFEPVSSVKQRNTLYYRIYVRNYIVYYTVRTEQEEKIMEIRGVFHKSRNRYDII